MRVEHVWFNPTKRWPLKALKNFTRNSAFMPSLTYKALPLILAFFSKITVLLSPATNRQCTAARRAALSFLFNGRHRFIDGFAEIATFGQIEQGEGNRAMSGR